MKRILSVLAAAALLVSMAGCRQVKDMTTDYKKLVRDTLAREYSFDAEMSYSGTTAVGHIQKTGETDIRVEFSAPAAFQGLVVSTKGEEIQAEYLGMELDLSVFEIPTQSVLTLLREVLAAPQPDNITVEVGEDTVTASGSIIIASYEIVFDKETMAIRSISVPSADAQLIVSNFVFDD